MLPVALLIANGLNMIGIIVLPKILDPSQFAIFSLASSIGLFIVALLFEWSRISIMRYGVAKDPADTAQRKHVLNRANGVVAAVLFVAAVCSLALGNHIYFTVFGLSLLFALSQALFEARQACFRAEFQDIPYIRNLIVRSLLGFAALCVVAYLTNSAVFTMWAWVGSFIVILLCTKDPLRVDRDARFDWTSLAFMVKFGTGVAVSAVATASLAPLLRLIATHLIPLDEAGKMMLAMDIAQKVIGVLGVSISLLIFQATVRAREFGHDHIVKERITKQVSIVFALISASVVGYLCVGDAFSALFISSDYREIYDENIVWCMAAAGLIGFRSFALDTIFVVTGRSQLGIISPVMTGLIAVVATIVLGWFTGFSSVTFSQGMLIGGAGGVLVSFVLSRLALSYSVNWLEILKIATANLGMWGILRLSASAHGLSGLILSVVIGCCVFGIALFALDALGLRAALRSLRTG